jgi:hypothetical protein
VKVNISENEGMSLKVLTVGGSDGGVMWRQYPQLLSVQAAVPKFMTLKLAPANGSSLSPGSTLQQRISVTNGMHGKKALIMRLRISYTSPTEGAQLRQAEVKNFPAGL